MTTPNTPSAPAEPKHCPVCYATVQCQHGFGMEPVITTGTYQQGAAPAEPNEKALNGLRAALERFHAEGDGYAMSIILASSIAEFLGSFETADFRAALAAAPTAATREAEGAEPESVEIADLWDRHFAADEWPPLMHKRFAFARELLTLATHPKPAPAESQTVPEALTAAEIHERVRPFIHMNGSHEMPDYLSIWEAAVAWAGHRKGSR